jgi:Na+/H+-dicarboxylate symporter
VPTLSSPAVRAILALVAGLALGLAVSSLAPDSAMRLAGWVDPVGTMWVNAIRMTVVPLIVASLVTAVSSAAPATVGRLGVRSVVVFTLILSTLAAIVALTVGVVFDRLAIDAGAAAAIRASAGVVQRPALPGFGSWLAALVPTNPVRAAADAAMLPLVFFSLAFGLALGRLDAVVREPVVAFFRGVAEAMTVLVRWVLVLAPIGVFALAFVLAAKLGTGVIGAAAFYVAAHSGYMIVAAVLMYVVVALFSTVGVARFARAALPAQVVAITTRSSMASLPIMLTSAERVLGLPRTITSFGLPFAVSTFRLNQPVSWLVMAAFAAKLYGVELGFEAVATLAVASVLMSFSVPGIPSGSLFVIAPFFASVGIPPESVGVLIALDLVPDLFKTLGNVTGHLAAVAVVSRGEVEPRPGE